MKGVQKVLHSGPADPGALLVAAPLARYLVSVLQIMLMAPSGSVPLQLELEAGEQCWVLKVMLGCQV